MTRKHECKTSPALRVARGQPKRASRPSSIKDEVKKSGTMSTGTSQHCLWILIGLASIGMAPHAQAADFQLSADFLVVDPNAKHLLPGLDAKSLTALPALQVGQLLAAAHGNSTSPASSTKPSPSVFVQSPQTKDQLIRAQPVAHIGDEEILAEAQQLAELPLAPTALPSKAPAAVAVTAESTHLGQLLAEAVKTKLVMRLKAGKLEIHPEALHLDLGSDPIEVVYEGLSDTPHIFLRDQKSLRWNAEQQQLSAHSVGRSEIFVTYRNQLLILPVEVQSASRPSLLGESPRVLQTLTSVLPLKDPSYTHLDQNFAAGEEPRGLSLATSAAEVDATRALTEAQRQRFIYPDPSPDYRTMAVQVIDERSVPEKQLLFPVSGVTVNLLGSPVVAKSDARGHAMFGDLPAGSRFWVRIQDDKGQIVPTVSELVLSRGKGQEVLRARTINSRTFLAYQSILDIAQDNQFGSFCGRTMQASGRESLNDIRVALNVEADGPFYIGQFGPQRDLQATDTSGRFCFFNVRPGLVEMSFFAGSNYLTATSLPIFPGAHMEEDLPLENSQGRRVFLAALPNAMEQIYEETANSELFQAVESAEIIAVGDNEPMNRISPNILGQEAGHTNFKGRVYALSQAPEFENILYTLDRSKEWKQYLPVVPLLQRGFVEDLFRELTLQDNRDSIAFDPALGHVLVYHALENGQTAVKMTLTDSLGNSREDAWYYGNPTQGMAKGVFFNLQPGIYQVKVESLQGALLAIDTIAVDFWTTALAQTGSSAQFSVGVRRQEE